MKFVIQSEITDKLEKAKKELYGYAGPMTAADITLASWNEFFSEGGTLNQPSGMSHDRVKKLQKKFVRLSRYHQKISV